MTAPSSLPSWQPIPESGSFGPYAGAIAVNAEFSLVDAWTAFMAPSAWQALTLASGWSLYGSGEAVAAYCIQGGFVKLKGLVVGGSGLITTLPVGYRPIETYELAVCAYTGHGRVTVGTDGTVTMREGNTAFVSLNQVSFDTR